MGNLLQDVRFGLRMLMKKPGFTLVAIIALSLGIGANTAIFSVVNAVLLRPLPFSEPERLVMVWGNMPQNQLGWDVLPVSAANYLDWREQTESFEHLAAFKTWAWHITGGAEPEQVWGARVSPNLFSALGTSPILGRTFTNEEDRPGSKVVIIGYGLWQRRFGADPGIVGKQVTLTNESYTVVGVMPQGFRFPGGSNFHPGFRFSQQNEMWMPLALTGEEAANRGTQNMAVLGRLKHGRSLEQAQAEMTAIARRLEEQHADTNAGMGVKLVRLHEQVTGSIRPALLILLGTVGFVLLIACANVANLLLARATTRQKEMAVRTALGASRTRVIRQLLTESTLLAIVGGLFGYLLALWGVDALVSLIPDDIPRATEIRVDGFMLAFTLIVSVMTGLIFGLAPALQASKTDVNEALKEGQRGTGASTSRSRVRDMLVVSEIALALVLLVGAGLLIRSFMRLREVKPGFDSTNVLTMEVVVPFLPPSKYADPERQSAFFHELTERAKALPGVETAGAVEALPLSGVVESSTFLIEGEDIPRADQQPQADYTEATPDYFRAMSIPLIKGRYFTEQDTKDAPGVVIVNQALVERFFPNQDAIGKRITFSAPDEQIKWLSIAGVVGDVKQAALSTESQPAVYLPQSQSPTPFMTLVVRGRVEPKQFAASVRELVKELDRDLPVTNIRTMDEVLAASVSQRRFNMLLLAIFAGVALLLSAVGIYGVMAYSVSQRAHEIGVRMALGAQTRDIMKMVVRQGMTLALLGVAIGLIGAVLLTRLMAGLVYGISTTDPMTFAAISFLIILIALAACLIPARRATRVDPMVALRYE